jgi:radical SAM protein with 4Fe4S-binding SPASM domain
MDFIVKPFHRYLKEHPEIKMNQRMISQNTYRKDKNFLSDIPFVSRKSEEQGDKKNENSTHKPTLYGCDAGINSYTITWDGKLIGCQLLGDCWTYPLETGFLKAWDEFPEHVFMPPLPAKCMECKVTCNACPATRLAETGLLNGHPAYICKEGKLAKEMEEELIDNIKEKIERKKEKYYETL